MERVAELSGVSRRQVIRAYAALRSAGYLESETTRRGARGRHRLVERVPIKLGGQQVATAVWPYIPLEHEEARKALADLLSSGHQLPRDGIVRVTIAIQVVEAGAVGESWPRPVGQNGGLVKLSPGSFYAAIGMLDTLSGACPGEGVGAI